MTPFKHALIAIDFSETTEPLVQCAGDLEALGTERITLLHVQPVQYPAAPQLTHRETYEEHLKQLASGLEEKGFQVNTTLRSGPPGSEIATAARELEAHLIVLAAHDHGTLKRGLLGSVASETLRHATVPVLLDHFSREDGASPEECSLRCREKLRLPLLATDGSDSAKAAEELAIQLSAGADRTILVTVIGGADEQAGHADLETLERRCQGEVIRRVERGARASEEIQRVADEEDASLILMGRRGRGGLRDRFLGSTAENLSQQTQRPIMILP